MIGRIRGNLVHKQPPVILVEVGGVGYEIQVPMTTLFQLPELGAPVSLVTHFVVREDAQLLYGFIDERDRVLFRLLIKVNGVGPKLALTILSGMDATNFVRCVQRDDMASLVALPGVGKKTAERMILELGGKLDFAKGDGTAGGLPGVYSQLDSALKNLGFKAPLVQTVLKQLKDDQGEEADFPTLLKLALGSLRKN